MAAPAAAAASAAATAAAAASASSSSSSSAAAPSTASPKSNDLLAGLEPLTPGTAHKANNAEIQIYAQPAGAAASKTADWSCKKCKYKNSGSDKKCYICKALPDGTGGKAADKKSVFADKVDMNAVGAAPTATAALDELMGTSAASASTASPPAAAAAASAKK